MRVLVLLDVMNFQVRTFLQKTPDIVPTTDVERIIYTELGGKIPVANDLGIDIFPYLSEGEQNRLYDKAGMLGMSGIRGTIPVRISKKRLLEAMKNAR